MVGSWLVVLAADPGQLQPSVPPKLFFKKIYKTISKLEFYRPSQGNAIQLNLVQNKVHVG